LAIEDKAGFKKGGMPKFVFVLDISRRILCVAE
jgi:hypothetical protein